MTADSLCTLADRFRLVQTTLEMHGGRADAACARGCYDAATAARRNIVGQLVRYGRPADELRLRWPEATVPIAATSGVTRAQLAVLQALCLDIQKLENLLCQHAFHAAQVADRADMVAA